MKKWPVLTVTVPEGISLEEWEVFCADVCGDEPSGYEERNPRSSGVPREAIFYFPSVEAEEGDVTAAVAHARALQEAARQLDGPGLSIRAEMMDDQDWTAGWREHFHTTHVSPRVFTAPPEEPGLPEGAARGSVVVLLDDVRPFGAGGHATTRAVLTLVEELLPGHASLLDVGAGTGVLCLAAVKLGAEFAVGMDNDPASERAFRHNAAINGVEDRAHFVAGSTVDEAVAGCLLAGRPIPALVVCNMLSTEFDALLAPLRRLRRPMVLGGFLLAEAKSVRARLDETGWRVARETAQVEWGAWLCEPDSE